MKAIILHLTVLPNQQLIDRLISQSRSATIVRQFANFPQQQYNNNNRIEPIISRRSKLRLSIAGSYSFYYIADLITSGVKFSTYTRYSTHSLTDG